MLFHKRSTRIISRSKQKIYHGWSTFASVPVTTEFGGIIHHPESLQLRNKTLGQEALLVELHCGIERSISPMSGKTIFLLENCTSWTHYLEFSSSKRKRLNRPKLSFACLRSSERGNSSTVRLANSFFPTESVYKPPPFVSCQTS